ncbi:hypothetical protein [Hahella ganghwensis]|uniref:hypothetical protein n=1 Tax=Hahella ganghwensis TaxID=286420 RepID=UPI00035C4067|nr:hypothetical protein [Hahella ganghwensis]
MGAGTQADESLMVGLRSLAEVAFPKRCVCCGRVYETLEEFVSQTTPCGTSGSGLREVTEEDGEVILELFRNCVCGSSLMEFCGDRRSQSESAAKLRERFEKLVMALESKGVNPDVARVELRKVVNGQQSELLATYLKDVTDI